MTAPDGPRVLSVVGPGRSGTTLLGNVLGEVQGVTNAGETYWLWERGLLEGRPCGCGRRPTECPVWSTVLDHVRRRQGWRPGDTALRSAAGAVSAAMREVLDRRNRLRAIRSASGAEEGWEALRLVRSVTADLHATLAEVTGSSLVVDTSKHAHLAALPAANDSSRHHVLHVVRDPRAVAWSWQRRKALPVGDGWGTMATITPGHSVGFWVENCLGAELLRRRVPRERWSFLRYEDFVAAPRARVERLLAVLGISAPAPFVSDDTVVLGINHTTAGNPNRFRTGTVRITDDDEWRARMPRHERALISAAAAPFLLRYGYPFRTSGAGDPGPTVPAPGRSA